METAYVGNSVSASDAQNTVGRIVIQAVEEKYTINNQIGNATVTVDVEKTNNVITDNATILISTTDFEVEGTITLNDGILTWNEIVPNTPRIKLNKNDLTLAPGGTATLSVKFKQLEETTIEWSTSDSNVATVSNGLVTIKTTANDDDTAIITAKAAYEDKEYTETCNVFVAQVSTPATQALINTSTMIGADVMNYTANNVSDWQVFYATEDEVFIISKNVLEKRVSLKKENISTNTLYTGSIDVETSNYGKKWNNIWLDSENMPNTFTNSKTVAYLCDKDNWKRYESSPANYAVGGPTIELLEKSVRIRQSSDISVSEQLTSTNAGYNSNISNLNAPYSVSGSFWWISSPYNYYDNGEADFVLGVDQNGTIGFGKSTLFLNNVGIRPLVSIPMNKVKIIGNKVKIDK